MTSQTSMHPELERLIRQAMERNASDLFLLAGEPVAWRASGKIERGEGEVLSAGDITEMAVAAVGRVALERLGSRAGEVHRSCTLDGISSVLISVGMASGEHTIAVGLSLPQVADVELLRVPEPLLEAARRLKGLIVFSGLAGSGKSTTAFSVVEYLNRTLPCHICTVEDPIYLRLTPKRALVQQREAGIDSPDAVAGMRAALAQDCDVLFLSEVKSVDQLEACIAAAETGHLVITVFNLAASPQEIIIRMIESFPENQRRPISRALAGVLSVVCSQILLPSTSGRQVAAYSVLLPDDEFRQAVADGGDLLSLQPGSATGSCTLQDSIRRLSEEGVISEETALAAAHTPPVFRT